MAITIYCSSCGAKHVAEITKPKFCSACGDPIDKAFKKEQAKSNKQLLTENTRYKATTPTKVEKKSIYQKFLSFFR